jgi:hypothetical protein
MSNFFSAVAQRLDETPLPEELQAAGADLAAFVDSDAYVREVYSISYDESLLQIHDYSRQQIGGIPALSSLIYRDLTDATRQS